MPIDTSIAGSYTITYDVTDSAGNTAVQVTRTVNVAVTSDVTPPVITLTDVSPLTINQNWSYSDAGATATDDTDGIITSSIVTTGLPIDTSVAGIYSITYNVTDSAGNAAVQAGRVIIILDTTIPVITLTGSSPVTINQNDSYTDAGATATDNEDGIITSSIITAGLPIDTSTLGSYTIT